MLKSRCLLILAVLATLACSSEKDHATGTRAVLDLSGTGGLFDTPFPFDLRRHPDGRPILGDFPNPKGNPIVSAYVSATESALDGGQVNRPRREEMRRNEMNEGMGDEVPEDHGRQCEPKGCPFVQEKKDDGDLDDERKNQCKEVGQHSAPNISSILITSESSGRYNDLAGGINTYTRLE